MDLVGRQREMAAIERLLHQAAGGRGGLLVVVGPAGAGKSAVADAACDAARQQGFTVLRSAPGVSRPGRLVWAQLLREAEGPEAIITTLPRETDPVALDVAARALTAGIRRLIVVDDVDHGGEEAADLLALVAARAAGSATAVVVTTTEPLGLGPELPLGPLSRADLASVVGNVGVAAQNALFLASGGWPGLGQRLARDLTVAEGEDPVVQLALRLASTAEFLDIDVALVGLVEAALARGVDDATRARLLGRLAYELLGDASAASRRRALIDEALTLARGADDTGALAEVLDARLHALWDPPGAEDRLAAAHDIIALARRSGDPERERRGLFWRFAALMELGRIEEAETALAAFGRAGAAAGDAEAHAVVTARHAMLAALRGRFDEAARLTEEFVTLGRRIALPDTDRLAATLHATIAMERGATEVPVGSAEMLFAYARRQPGHLFEATAAVVLAIEGRTAEASAELDRCLPRALNASGPRWLRAMAELAWVAVIVDDDRAAAAIYTAMLPYRGRFIVSGGANSSMGPASHFLGLLALQLGQSDDAIALLGEAAAMQEQVGALPGLAKSLAVLSIAERRRASPGDNERADTHRGLADSLVERLGLGDFADWLFADGEIDEWALQRDGDDWLLVAGDERTRLRDGRGVQYLRVLLASPGQEIAALDLVAGGTGLAATAADPIIDATASASYRERLAVLEADLDAADRAGDQTKAETAQAEHDWLVDELRRTIGLGGRSRPATDEAERARVNVTRTLRATIARLKTPAPRIAEHLEASLRTGRMCCYTPAPDGPSRWRL